MLHICLLIVFGSMMLHDQGLVLVEAGPDSRWAAPLFVVGVCVVLAGVLQSVAVAARKRAELTGSLRGIEGIDKASAFARVVACGVTFLGIQVFGWLDVVRGFVGDWIVIDELVAIVPMIGVFLAAWWAAYPMERLLREAVFMRMLDEGRPVHPLPSRGGFVWMHTRHHLFLLLLPMLLLWAWNEAISFGSFTIYRRASTSEYWAGVWQWIQSDTGSLVVVLLQFGGIAILILLFPLAIRFIWNTVPFTEGSLAQRLMSMCRSQRVRIRSILVWRTGGTMVNGAVLGATGRARYILLTDSLLEYMPEPMIEAVMAHEIAHVKHKHVPWLTAGLLAMSILLVMLIGYGFVLTSRYTIEEIAPGWQVAISLWTLVAALLGFGWISRRFEWQADAFAVRYLSENMPRESGEVAVRLEAVEAMCGALATVAELNHLPPSQFTFRHGSISTRIAKLRSLVGVPVERMPIDQTSRRIKWTLAIAMFIVLVSLIAPAMMSKDARSTHSSEDRDAGRRGQTSTRSK